MSEKERIDKRDYIRLENALPVQFKITGDDSGTVYRAVTRNISHGGLCIEMTENVSDVLDKLESDGGSLDIRLELGAKKHPVQVEGRPVWGSGRIDWVQKPTRKNAVLLMGMAFDNLTDEAKGQIHTFIVDEFVRNYGK